MKITFLGLGAMGSRMCAALLDAGYELTVWNRSSAKATELQQRGATVATTPREAVREADTVIAMLRDDIASRDVWLCDEAGALQGMKRGTVAIECSTLSFEWATQLSVRAEDANVPLLIAPVLGSTPSADSRQLIALVGGDVDAFERAKPVLATMTKAALYIGSAAHAAYAKLAANALLGVQAAAVAEVINKARYAGVNATKLFEVLAQTALCSVSANSTARDMLAADFTPKFPIALFEKDLRYFGACQFEQVPITPSVLLTTGDVFKAATLSGLGELHYTALVKLAHTTR
jgi:3-hydroxyisobutyrate dehydrogenase